MKIVSTAAFVATTLLAANANAFCGFYVAKADTKLFNKASKVAIVRDEDKTVVTLSNDFQGDLKDFAIVIPVPVQLEKEQIHIGERALLDRLDAYSSPRLVEYYDNNPCQMMYPAVARAMPNAGAAAGMMAKEDRVEHAKSLGVKIEAQYTVGEYDIVILSAKQSDGLGIWLGEEGYKLPKGATEVLGSYIKQQMHFFIAKVNLKEQAKSGFTFLRPIQMAYSSPKFMLPIRLGTVNADGPQELFVYTLTKGGRVETTNYRTVKLPSDVNVPEYVKDEFGKFYKSMFATAVKKEDMHAVFTEYAWDMAWCDPCAADPLSQDELHKLGVFWLNNTPQMGGQLQPGGARRGGGMAPPPPMINYGGASNVFLTRLHVRYDSDHFPEDLTFQQTSDRTNFQGRYIMQHAFQGYEKASCEAMKGYRQQLLTRHETEAKKLAELTGWDESDIRKKMKLDDEAKGATEQDKDWYKNLWK